MDNRCVSDQTMASHLHTPLQVPAMKRTVERFVFRIKLLLAETDQADAFWLGALKHKNLQGQEASSQVGCRPGVPLLSWVPAR